LKTEDEEGFARIIGCDAHRDAATSLAMAQATSCLESCVFKSCVFEEIAAFAEDAAEDFGDGGDELAVGDFVADGPSPPRLRRAFFAFVSSPLACYS
jgi:hypothetical protein